MPVSREAKVVPIHPDGTLVPMLQASLDAVEARKGRFPPKDAAYSSQGTTAWLMAPSRGFVRDVRGSAWIDSATERTRGRPKRIKTARASGYAHQVTSSFAVDLREERHLLLGVCRFSRDELEVLASFDPDDPKAMEPIDAALAEAKASVGLWWMADRGSLVHEILEYDDRGVAVPDELVTRARDEFRITAAVLERLRVNWRAMLERYGVRVVAIEQTVVTDEFNVAGTLDRLVELQRDLSLAGHLLAAGTIMVLDAKTSSLWLANGVPAYWGPYACQVYLYAASVPYLVGVDGYADRRVPWPFRGGIDQEHGLIGHINLNPLDGPLGACSLWHVDLTAGRQLALLSQEARRFEARRDIFTPSV
jgi:hypothetical protein